MKKIVITYGLISGLIIIMMFIVTMPFHDSISINNAMLIGYTTMILGFSIIYFAISNFKKKNSGNITYKQGFLIGIQITLIACVIYSLLWMVLSATLYPDYMTKFSTKMIDEMKASGASEKDIQEQMTQMKQWIEYYKNPLMKFIMTCMEPLPVGLIISLITPLILRSKKNKIAVG